MHEKEQVKMEKKMSAPSKANIIKLDNPAHVMVSHQHETELWV